MSDAPKIVRDRLRAGVPREAHPEADVLTAFAERALSGTERESVVRHLARCEECREVVALSLPPLADTATQPEFERNEVGARERVDRAHSWFAWPNLRWAALAASVVVVASVLMLRPSKETAPTDASLIVPAVKVPAVAETTSTTAAKPAPESRSSEVTFNKAARGHQRASSGARRDEGFSAGLPVQVPSESPALADRKVDSVSGGTRVSLDKDTAIHSEARSAAPVAQGEVKPPERMRSSQETVEVASANAMVQTEAAQIEPPAANEVRTLPVEKAKPALKEEVDAKTQAQNSLTKSRLEATYETSNSAATLQKLGAKRSKNVTAQWSLIDGKLQRSLDAGATRQVVLQLQTSLLAFGARGNDVWAGGQAGTLLHSSDGGSSWATMRPAAKAGALSSDIVGIDVRSAAEIILSTITGETWATADGGKTWDKK